MKNWSVDPPEWSAFECVDGFAWHPRESFRHCHKGQVICSAETLGTVYQGEPVERVLALRTLLVECRNQRLTLARVFPTCERCGSARIEQIRSTWRRAAMAIHEEAIALIREARPSLHLLRDVNLPEHRPQGSGWYKTVFARAIPVRDPKWDRRHPPTGEATRMAQIFWASNLIAAREARVA